MTNAQLLETHRALQEASGQRLPGRQALQVGRALQKTSQAAQPLQQVRRELLGRAQDPEEDMTEEEANKEWQEVLLDTVDVAIERVSDAVLDRLELPAWVALALDRIIGGNPNDEAESPMIRKEADH